MRAMMNHRHQLGRARVRDCECQMDALTIPFNLELDIGLTPINSDAG